MADSVGETIKHGSRRRPIEEALIGPNVARIVEHVSAHIAPAEKVFHEIDSDLVHLDVHIIPPSDDREFYTLFTSGMSDLPMNAPEGSNTPQYAELLLCLPKNWLLPWEVTDWAGTPEEAYWPVYWLKSLARMPHAFETFLAPGHTVPNGDPPENYAGNTKLCCCLIGNPTIADETIRQLRIDDEETIHFYAVIPIYREEMNFKLKNGPEALHEKLLGAGVTELLNIKRKNVCKKRFLFF